MLWLVEVGLPAIVPFPLLHKVLRGGGWEN